MKSSSKNYGYKTELQLHFQSFDIAKFFYRSLCASYWALFCGCKLVAKERRFTTHKLLVKCLQRTHIPSRRLSERWHHDSVTQSRTVSLIFLGRRPGGKLRPHTAKTVDRSRQGLSKHRLSPAYDPGTCPPRISYCRRSEQCEFSKAVFKENPLSSIPIIPTRASSFQKTMK
jgi:hypothetical protein